MQQAVEKAINGARASGAEIPHTHDLTLLLDIIAQRKIRAPASVAQADWLTPWAVAARYGASAAPLDRGMAITVAHDAVD